MSLHYLYTMLLLTCYPPEKYWTIFLHAKDKTGNPMWLPLRNQMTYNVQHRVGAPPCGRPKRYRIWQNRCPHGGVTKHIRILHDIHSRPCDITQHIMHTQSVGADRYGKLLIPTVNHTGAPEKTLKTIFTFQRFLFFILKLKIRSNFLHYNSLYPGL